MKKNLSYLLIALSVTLLFSLTACGKSPSTVSTTPSDSLLSQSHSNGDRDTPYDQKTQTMINNPASPSHPQDDQTILPSLAQKLREDFTQWRVSVEGVHEELVPENIWVQKYFGNYNGCEVVYMGGPWSYTMAIRPVSVAEYLITFPSGQELYVYQNDTFHTLPEAYELGLLTKQNIYDIGTAVDPIFAQNNTELGVIPTTTTSPSSEFSDLPYPPSLKIQYLSGIESGERTIEHSLSARGLITWHYVDGNGRVQTLYACSNRPYDHQDTPRISLNEVKDGRINMLLPSNLSIVQRSVHAYPIGQYNPENAVPQNIDDDTFSLMEGDRYYEIIIQYHSGMVTYGFFIMENDAPEA